MTEQDQAPSVTGDDTQGHGHGWDTQHNDTQGHGYHNRDSQDDDTKDDDTQGHGYHG